jgi:hypothetical protein
MVTMKRNLLEENYLLECMKAWWTNDIPGFNNPSTLSLWPYCYKASHLLHIEAISLKSPSAGFKTATQALCVQSVLEWNSNLLWIMPNARMKIFAMDSFFALNGFLWWYQYDNCVLEQLEN